MYSDDINIKVQKNISKVMYWFLFCNLERTTTISASNKLVINEHAFLDCRYSSTDKHEHGFEGVM
jgi:hypothetical protein